MNLPENYEARKGDIVLVRATVRYTLDSEHGPATISVSVGRYDTAVSIEPGQIERVLIPFFEVGEIVTIEGTLGLWKIRAIQDGAAWVQSPDGVFKTTSAVSLSRIPKTLAPNDDEVEV